MSRMVNRTPTVSKLSNGTVPANPAARYPFEPAPGELGMGPDELEAIGEIGGEGQVQGAILELIPLLYRLKARREALGLSLTDVSERSGLTRQVVSKLENGRTINPTLATLARYALAVDSIVTLGSRMSNRVNEDDVVRRRGLDALHGGFLQ